MPDTELIEELESRDIVMDGWHEPTVILTPDERDSLIATVKQLREQLFEEQARNQTQADSIMNAESEITSLQSQLEQLRAENAQLRNALLPFALLDIRHLQERSDNEPIWAINKTQITNGHIRSAQKLIQQAVDLEKLT